MDVSRVQGQRWRCPGYSPRNTMIVPYSSTEIVQGLPPVRLEDQEMLIYFRCGLCSIVEADRKSG